jgi:hypothetical protein
VFLGGKRLDPKDAKVLSEEMKTANQKMTSDAVPIDADEPWKSPNANLLDLHK